MKRWVTILVFVCIAVMYAMLTQSSIVWLATALAAPAARGNLIVMSIIAVMAGRALVTTQLRITVSARAMVMVAAATVAYGVAQRFTPWNRPLAVITLIGAYGLAGCLLTPSAFRRGLAALGLVLVALPFGEQLDVFIGYPLRVVIADVAQSVLSHLGAHGTSRATLLLFDSGAAQIDVPCSGVKSLWAGAILMLAAPLALGKRFDGRWLGANVAFVVALCAGNLLRIVILVLLAVPAQQGKLAEVLHRPLGCVGFVVAALAYVAFMQRGPGVSTPAPMQWKTEPQLAFAVLGLIVVTLWSSPSAAAAPVIDETPFVALPARLVTETLELTAIERSFYARQGAEHVSKVRFTWDERVHGSLILVRATATAQHPPEQCLSSAGHDIRAASTVLLGSTLSVRVLELERGAAVSWFQSGYATHGDYAARAWAGGVWTQVSILMDDGDAAHLPFDMIHALHHAIAVAYQGDS